MELTVRTRRGELQAAIDAKVRGVSKKLREGRERLLAEEAVVREEWERIISGKLQKEFPKKRSVSSKNSKIRREERILEVIGQLERATREESGSLSHTIEKEKKEHAIYVARLRRRRDEVALELGDLRERAQAEDLDREIGELRAALEKCRCREYREELWALARQRAAAEDELGRIRHHQKGTITKSSEWEAVRAPIAKAEAERVTMKARLSALANQMRARKAEADDAAAEMERRHKEQIAAIGERVKQTVAMKNQVIEQLKGKLRECGLLTAV
jgi:hypothetical protein